MNYRLVIPSPVGNLTLISDGTSLTWLAIQGQRFMPPDEVQTETPSLPVFSVIQRWLDRYFKGCNPAVDMLPLRPSGSPFRQSVWSLLQRIPYGMAITYGHLASLLASERGRCVAAQAVGNAVGHNPISIIIPCHRVIGTGGRLVGYGAGLSVKQQLLSLEQTSLTDEHL